MIEYLFVGFILLCISSICFSRRQVFVSALLCMVLLFMVLLCLVLFCVCVCVTSIVCVCVCV